MILGMLALFITNYLSGFFLYRFFFKDTNILERIFLPQVLSLITTPIIFFLLYLIFGFDLSVLILPFVLLAIFLASLKIKQKTHKIKVDKKLLMIAFVFLILYAFINTFILSYHQYTQTRDLAFRQTIASDIKNSKILPPHYLCLYEESVKYQWFSLLMASLFSIYVNMPIFNIWPVFSFYLAILFFAESYILGKYYFKDEKIAIFFMVIISLFFSTWKGMDPQMYTYLFLPVFFYAFFIAMRTGSNKLFFLCGLIGALTMYFHAISFIFICLVIYSFVMYRLIFTHDIIKIIKQMIFLILPFVFAIPYYIIIKGAGDSSFIFLPFGNLLRNYYSILGNLFLPLLFIGIYQAMKSKDKYKSVCLAIIIVTFIFVNMLEIRRVGGGISRFIFYLALPISFMSLDFFKRINPKLRNILFLVCIILVLIPRLNQAAWNYSNPNFLTTDEYAVSMWIEDNTKNEIILSAPTAIYISLPETKSVICEPFFLLPFSANAELVKERFGDLILMYTKPSQDLFRKHNVSYVILGDEETTFFKSYDLLPYDFSTSAAFKNISIIGGYTIFKLTDIANLPKSTEEERKSLNFTYYSRWFFVD